MSHGEDAYRAHVRAWLEANTEPLAEVDGYPTRYWMHGPDLDAAHYEACRSMRTALYDAGFVGITLPRELGGQGGAAWMERIFAEEAADRNVDTGFLHAIASMALPALLHYGTQEQQVEHVPGMLSARTRWCQLFSEPGAGSDLAGLACRAERDGDEFVINGQKVWNSAAVYADKGLLLARTDPSVAKHAGITFLLLDMNQPGVEARRLVQANGAGHFSEVFLTDARCSVTDVLGEVDDGWRVARMVMASESATIGAAPIDYVARLRNLARATGQDIDPTVRQDLAAVWTRQRLQRLTGARLAHAHRTGTPTGIHPSALKIGASEQRIAEGDLATRLLGAAATAIDHEASAWAMDLLHMRFGMTIGGGTDQVHRNNIAEQALGLPREPNPDKGLPWNETRRSGIGPA